MGVEDVRSMSGRGPPIRPFSNPLWSWPKKRTLGPRCRSPCSKYALNEVVVVPMAIGGCAPEERVLVELEAGTGRAAERQVVVVPITQGDVLQDVEPIGPPAGVLEIAVVLVVAEQLVIVEVGALRRLAAGSQASPRGRWSGGVGRALGPAADSGAVGERRGAGSWAAERGIGGDSRAQRQDDDPNWDGCSARGIPVLPGPLTANSGVSSPVIGDGETLA